MDWITQWETWVAFFTLTTLELVLGIDNIVFISILAGKLPKEQQQKARQVGLLLAMGMRILLLLVIGAVMRLVEPLFSLFEHEFSGKDLILIIGGFFLLGKATHEIHQKLEGDESVSSRRVSASFVSVIVQIMLLDIVFSLDSVITAVGMADRVEVMIAAVVVAVFFMMLFAKPVGEFVEKHPTVKMLALSFLLLVGMTLMVEGFGGELSKGYIYSAMGFSVFVEMLNLRLMKRRKQIVDLAEPRVRLDPAPAGIGDVPAGNGDVPTGNGEA